MTTSQTGSIDSQRAHETSAADSAGSNDLPRSDGVGNQVGNVAGAMTGEVADEVARVAAGNVADRPDGNFAPGRDREATRPVEIGGQAGPEPTRYGDWEKKGRCTDF